MQQRYEKFTTKRVELGSDELKALGMGIISSRQYKIQGAQEQVEEIEKRIAKAVPDLVEELGEAKKYLKSEKKYLADTIKGIKSEPYLVFADVIHQVSEEGEGMIDAVENTGVGAVLETFPGMPNQIVDSESEDNRGLEE